MLAKVAALFNGAACHCEAEAMVIRPDKAKYFNKVKIPTLRGAGAFY
jgi:hypothetical protein